MYIDFGKKLKIPACFSAVSHSLENEWRKRRCLLKRGIGRDSFSLTRILLTQEEVKGGAPSSPPSGA